MTRGINYTNQQAFEFNGHMNMISQGQNFQLFFLLHTLIEILVLVNLILLAIWLFKQIAKK